jgi:hypothetical protein
MSQTSRDKFKNVHIFPDEWEIFKKLNILSVTAIEKLNLRFLE